ncbi:hypothetical protein EDD18DRAFT_574415 [Armillaria luteobubalina]|uniref:Uncharacterized protein n=1 Tax=Armillaria luteobubalina TaxID=153913 RepID=A0AA39UJ08_9AGAR|nr:hypothetical protein EDD18DRAFT_574415 [Armillaria luteobubalina]
MSKITGIYGRLNTLDMFFILRCRQKRCCRVAFPNTRIRWEVGKWVRFFLRMHLSVIEKFLDIEKYTRENGGPHFLRNEQADSETLILDIQVRLFRFSWHLCALTLVLRRSLFYTREGQQCLPWKGFHCLVRCAPWHTSPGPRLTERRQMMSLVSGGGLTSNSVPPLECHSRLALRIQAKEGSSRVEASPIIGYVDFSFVPHIVSPWNIVVLLFFGLCNEKINPRKETTCACFSSRVVGTSLLFALPSLGKRTRDYCVTALSEVHPCLGAKAASLM